MAESNSRINESTIHRWLPTAVQISTILVFLGIAWGSLNGKLEGLESRQDRDRQDLREELRYLRQRVDASSRQSTNLLHNAPAQSVTVGNTPIDAATTHRDYLTAREVALREGVVRDTVYNLLANGQIPGAKKVDNVWRFPKDYIITAPPQDP